MIELLLFYLFSLLLLASSSRRTIPYVFVLIVIGLSVVSFFYTPLETSDLYRHHENIVLYGEMGFDWVLENRLNINPLSHLLYYVFSFLGEPRLYASFSIFITYGFIFLLLHRLSAFYGLSKKSIFLLSAFLLLNWNYLMVVSNCRIFMLYSIIAYFYYMEFYENKCHKSALIVYIASVFFHYGILLVVIPRFLLYLYRPTNRKVYLYMFLFILLYLFVGRHMLLSILVESVAEKIERYENYSTFGRLQYYNSIFTILTCCLCVVIERLDVPRNRRYYILFFITIFILLLQVSNYQVVYRESNFIASLSVILLAQVITGKKYSGLIRTILSVQTAITFVYYLVYEYQFIGFNFIV